MCSKFPGSLVRLPTRHIIYPDKGLNNIVKSEEYSEITNLCKLWKGAPIRFEQNLPADEKAFSISRNNEEVYKKYRDRMRIVNEPNVILNTRRNSDREDFISNLWDFSLWFPHKLNVEKFWMPFLPPKKDILIGCKAVFLIILNCIRKGNFDELRDATAGKNTLDFHRQRALTLSEKQKESLKVGENDFIGRDGFVTRWNGFGGMYDRPARYIHHLSPTPVDAAGHLEQYVMYTVVLAALVQKNELFKSVRSLDLNSSQAIKMRMPLGYGFKAPRYVVMMLQMCHKIELDIKTPLTVGEDAMLYDFHVHSFAQSSEFLL